MTRRHTWLPALVALVLAGAAYAPALEKGRVLAGRDLFHLFYPIGRSVAESARLVPPARDPSRGLGVALAADPLAWSFYPGRLIHHLGDFDRAFALALLAHGALAGLGAYVLARELGATRKAGLLAIVGATLAGPVLSLHRHPNLLAGAAWAPLVVAWLLRGLLLAARREAWRWHALAALGVGMIVLAGGVEVLLGLTLVLGACFLASVLWRSPGSRLPGKRLGGLVLVLALGLALGAVQLVPTWRWLPETARPGAVAARDASEWSLPAERLVALVARGMDPGEPGVAYGSFSTSVYLGRAIVVLALLAALRGDRRARGLALGVVLLLVASLGAKGYLFTALRVLPGFDRFRYPEKLLLVATVLIPALAARGLSGLLATSWAEGQRHVVLVAAAGLLGWQTHDLLRDAHELIPTVPAALVREAPSTVALIGSGRYVSQVAAVERYQVPAGTPAEKRLLLVSERRRKALYGLGGVFGREDAKVYGPFAPWRLVVLLEEAGESFVDLASVTGVITTKRAAGAWEHVTVPGEDDLVVVRTPGGPRARLFSRARSTTLADLRLRISMAKPGEAVTEGFELAEEGEPGTAEVVERDADHVLVATRGSGQRLLVVSELFGGGVSARVDGAMVKPVPAFAALVGVPVPAGEHRVLLEWCVPGLGVGGAISLGALGVVLALVVGGRRDRAG